MTRPLVIVVAVGRNGAIARLLPLPRRAGGRAAQAARVAFMDASSRFRAMDT